MCARLLAAAAALLLAGTSGAFAHQAPAGGNPAAAAQAAQEAAAAKLVKPPADARKWVITSGPGQIHGSAQSWTTPDGTRWSRDSLLLRGLRNETEQQMRIDADGSLQSLAVNGFTFQGDATERFDAATGTFSTPVDRGSVAGAPPGGVYVPYGGTADFNFWFIEKLHAAPGRTLALLPGGRASMAPLTRLTVTGPGGARKDIEAWAVTGIGLAPLPVWMDGARVFGVATFLNVLPAGWEDNAPAMTKAQDEALARRTPEIARAIARKPTTPVVFRNVTLYDSVARSFVPGVSVWVEDGRIARVAPAAQMPVPADIAVIDGTGKTLLPGLWDNHMHYGGDETGPLLLSMGVTSVRDPGNRPETSTARKARIDRGELLGPRILPMMLLDGPGPLSAQVAVVVKDEAEALAAVDRAKSMGFAGVKLYGSLDPKLVKPIAERAHAHGMRVAGHVPRTMRPIEAVRAGYDELTHINWVMMQMMPEAVIQESNGLARFYGPGRYAADVSLKAPEVQAYLDELKARGTDVDVTLAIFEGGYCYGNGQMGPSYAPYADIVPPSVRRQFLSGGFAETPELSRERMCASYGRLAELVTELYRKGIPVLAGTDGFGVELIRDLELYQKAGMSAGEALAAATIIPAETFGMAGEIGSIAPGKRSDLFLVDGDVSKDFGAIRRVLWVMQGDRLMDANKLREAAGLSGMPK